MLEIFAFDKKLVKVDPEDLVNFKDKPLWIDCKDLTKEEAESLKNTFDLHQLSVEDLLNANTRIKVEEFPNYLLCVFYTIESKKKFVELKEFDLILGTNFVISSYLKNLEASEFLKQNPDQLEKLFAKGADFVMHKIIDFEVDRFFPILEHIDEKLYELDEKVAKNPNRHNLDKVLEIKKNVMKIKRLVNPQREKISFLAKHDYKFISKKSVPYFRDLYDHFILIAENADAQRDAITNTYELYMSTVSHNLNEIMKFLSVIATIALPLTLISSIYGTNFKILPGADSPQGFWIMIILMSVLVFFLGYYFKKKGWF